MARRIDRPPAYRKQSTLELPPTDSTGLTLNIQPLQKRLTQQWLDYDAPFSLVREPEGLLPAVDDTLRDIEDVHQKHWPSRSSSSDSENDVSEGLRRLDLEDREDRYFRTKFPPYLDYGLPPGFASFGPPTDPSRGSGSRPGPSRQSSGRSRGYSSSKGPVKGSAASGGVRDGRIIKPAGGTQTKATRKTAVPQARTPLKPFGCPMVKANPGRYEGVDAPCTDLKGIKATSKALMEHLKKHHSRDNRCLTCYKWCKNPGELLQHQQEPHHPWEKCDTCCKRFASKEDYEEHPQALCRLDENTKPELFSPEQQEVFRGMNRQIGRQGDIESKYRWAFRELFPGHPERETIWPWYDFAVFKHKLPQPPSVSDLETIAGGLRLPQSSDGSPSEETDSPVLETPVEALSNPFFVPSPVGYPEMGRQMHPAPGSNNVQHAGSLRRSSAPAHIPFLNVPPQQLNYAYPPPMSSSIPSAPYLTDDGSIITSHAPRTPSLLPNIIGSFHNTMTGAGGFTNEGMLSAPNLPASAVDYFKQQPLPDVFQDVSAPMGMRPVPTLASDNLQPIYSEEFWDKHGTGHVPWNLQGYQQPVATAGGHAQQQHHDGPAAGEAEPGAPPLQWDQSFKQFSYSHG